MYDIEKLPCLNVRHYNIKKTLVQKKMLADVHTEYTEVKLTAMLSAWPIMGNSPLLFPSVTQPSPCMS